MSGPEAKVKQAIKGYLRSLASCWFFMPVPYGYGVNGVPDFVGCYKGVFFAIEAKAPGKMSTLTPLQKAAIAGINGAGGWAIASDNLERVVEMFRLIDISLKEAA